VYLWNYYGELRIVKAELNDLENVEVVSITGHHDITLEEITAHINIKNKGDLIIYGLKPNYQFEYKKSITLVQIGNYNFKQVSCDPYSDCKGFVGFGSSLYFNGIYIHGNKLL